MKIAIMQPYFLPYIGYWQLINCVDIFIVYDNIQYTKKGWITRNRYLKNGDPELFSLSLKKDSDYLNINQRYLSDNFNPQKNLNQIRNMYLKAPYFKEVYPIFENIFLYNENNLFQYIYFSIQKICKYLEVSTKIVISSSLKINHDLKSESKIIAMCNKINGSTYINPIGGTKLYSKKNFNDHNLHLQFLKPRVIEYQQFQHPFVPWLSILDIMMFNSKTKIKLMLKEFELI